MPNVPCRSLIIAAGIVLLGNPAAHARTTCQPGPQGTLCTSEVDFAQFAETAFMQQQSTEWCWAASISMVFSYYKHPVSQSRIVTEVYGGLANLPATGYVIANKLNGCLVDDLGDSFRSTLVAAYDYQAGVYAITNQQIIKALDQGQPLIIGTSQHAMVLTAVQYYPGANIVAAGVFDPWPGRGARLLDMAELYPAHLGGSLMFLALPSVTTVASCQVTPPAGSGSDMGSDSDPGSTCEGDACCSASRGGSGLASIIVVCMSVLLVRRRRAYGVI